MKNSLFKNMRGSALLAVMLVVAMVSIIGLGILTASFSNVHQAGNTREFEKSYYDAENDLSKEVDALRLAVSAEYDSLLYYKQNDQTTYNSKFSTFYDDIKTGITDRMSKAASTGVDYSVDYTIYNSGDIGNEYAVYTLRVETAKTSMNRFVDTTMNVKRMHIVTNNSWDSEDVLYVDGNVWDNSSKYDVYIGSGNVAIPSDANSAEKQSVLDNLNISSVQTTDIQPWDIDFTKLISDIKASVPASQIVSYKASSQTIGKSSKVKGKIIIAECNTLTLSAADIEGSIIICKKYNNAGCNVTISNYSSAVTNALDGACIFTDGSVTFTNNSHKGLNDSYQHGIFIYANNGFWDSDATQSFHDLPIVLYTNGTANFASFADTYTGQIIAQNSITFTPKKNTTLNFDSNLVENFYSNFPSYIPKPDFSGSGSSGGSYSIPTGIISGSGKITETVK